MEDRVTLERATGQLFSGLWDRYDEKLFEESVELFFKRLKKAQFDPDWFNGKVCLDAGCGGGRNSIAMARLGATKVYGIDVGEQGLADARRRAQDLSNINFQTGSIMDIPFENEKFDMVWCAGVLMITADDEKALDELARVTKKGGYLYLLVYASGGLRWPLIQWLRPLAEQLGQSNIEEAIQLAGLSSAKRRTFLDDLFCPRLDFLHWDRLSGMLAKRGFQQIRRWGVECRLDHEADLESYRADLEALGAIFAAGANGAFGPCNALFDIGRDAVRRTVDAIKWFEDAVRQGELSNAAAMDRVIGQGHHRVLAVKS